MGYVIAKKVWVLSALEIDEHGQHRINRHERRELATFTSQEEAIADLPKYCDWHEVLGWLPKDCEHTYWRCIIEELADEIAEGTPRELMQALMLIDDMKGMVN